MIELSPVERTGALSKEEFLSGHKQPEKPVIMEELTRPWPARGKWTLEHLVDVAGHVEVPLYDSKPSRGHKHQHAPAARMPLRDYLERLAQGEQDLRMFFFNLFAAVPELARDFNFPDIGLKFFKKLPVLFMGGKGARVQLHFDVDLSDNLLCHFGGRKRVMLFDREQTRYLYRVPFSFSALHEVKVDAPDYDRFPALEHLRGHIATLSHGDALYIPPGFWHYVIYDEIGFSLSLRAFPRKPRDALPMAYNLAVLRPVEGIMRKIVGQPWNDWNERRAVKRTHRGLQLS